jgi:hypothetical protein
MVDEKDIVKFKELYAARFGIEIDDKAARRKLTILVKQMEIVYQPIRRADAEYVNGDVNRNETPQKL